MRDSHGDDGKERYTQRPRAQEHHDWRFPASRIRFLQKSEGLVYFPGSDEQSRICYSSFHVHRRKSSPIIRNGLVVKFNSSWTLAGRPDEQDSEMGKTEDFEKKKMEEKNIVSTHPTTPPHPLTLCDPPKNLLSFWVPRDPRRGLFFNPNFVKREKKKLIYFIRKTNVKEKKKII